jgi:hypothetical protein
MKPINQEKNPSINFKQVTKRKFNVVTFYF